MKRRDVLEAAEWAEAEFGSLTSGGAIRLREIMRCVRAGLLVSVGLVLVCDGDGLHLDPERYRTGFKLTEKGRALLR